MHSLQQIKAQIFKSYTPPMAIPEISYKSRAIFTSSSSLFKTGFFRITRTASIAVIRANVHIQTSIELKALIFRFPIQLLSKVQ